jgi:hypothetical protein
VENSIGGFLKVLPKIADHPLAIVAYICLVAATLLWFYRRSKSNDFLKALQLIPESQRVAFCQKAGYNYHELAQLPPKDRLKRLMARDKLLLIIAMIIAAALLGIVAIQKIHEESRAPASPSSQTIENNATISAPVQNAIGNSNVQTINR